MGEGRGPGSTEKAGGWGDGGHYKQRLHRTEGQGGAEPADQGQAAKQWSWLGQQSNLGDCCEGCGYTRSRRPAEGSRGSEDGSKRP